jgi:hypothetical protein
MREWQSGPIKPGTFIDHRPKFGRLWLALCFPDNYWSFPVNLHVYRRSIGRYYALSTTIFIEKPTVSMQCSDGGID